MAKEYCIITGIGRPNQEALHEVSRRCENSKDLLIGIFGVGRIIDVDSGSFFSRNMQ